MNTKLGAVNHILNDVCNTICTGSMDDVRKRIIRLQISLKTGLNLSDYKPDTLDQEEDIKKILDAVRSPEVGLKDYQYNF